MKIMKLILASSSPRRKELLKQIGLRFAVVPSGVEEKIKDGECPVDHVLRLAEEKALDVAKDLKDSWVIAADTIVLVNGEILGKPAGKQDAYQMLLKLSGKEHRVITGFCILNTGNGETIKESVETTVTFKELTEEEIRGYIKTEEPFDKAGGYAIQGKGSFMIREIKGSYTNVIGLPICEVVEALERVGRVRLFDGAR
ncbi:MAG: septum formation inhibitor Maf [Desulfobacterales bacterium]|nr:septum formation inhibitor Maf [Desulfobacterales bacterium]